MDAAAERKARLRALREAAGAAYPSGPAEEAPSEPLTTAPEDECALALLPSLLLLLSATPSHAMSRHSTLFVCAGDRGQSPPCPTHPGDHPH